MLSDGFRKVTGFSVEECLHPEGWRDLVHPDDRGMVAEHVLKAFDGLSSTITYLHCTKDGSVGGGGKIMDIAKAAAMMTIGNPRAIVASAIDITNRKETTV